MARALSPGHQRRPRSTDSRRPWRRQQGMKDDETALYDFCSEMYRDRNVSDATFKAAVAKFGERGIMDVIGIIGYYDLVSMALIVQQTTGKPGDEPPLLPLTR